QALVDEQCREHRRVTAPSPAQPVTAATTRLAPPAASAGPGPSASAAAGETLSAIGAASPAVSTASAAEEVPSLAELLATVQQCQPLVAAGPTSNGTNP